ncbi:putative lipid-transfer protein DIR1 [Pyrus x bretschneideri]|uniref:putative lipid-transfer protein DIR1 n=1 Tax=Pyrus x bretschneideri TaxID=225117 RepID=UPI00202FE881|nr:putative lipid-transfer protein DIR1 [Pyrus x bretschneideri]
MRKDMEGARQKLVVVLAAVVLVAIAGNGGFVHVVNAQNICNVSVSDLMSCRPAVTSPNPAPPTKACCAALSHANLSCLCSYKNSSVLPSLGIDPNLALQLPAKCKLPHPANC